MLTFQGKNLCERQKELNFKVKEAVQHNVNFQDVKSAQEYTDVDRLFKIDLASKYKDTDYFIDVLKCGDSLYISRALKWEWIYENAYSQIINPDYLHHNIFPTMSFKMKIKTLSTIAKHIRDEARAQIFYEYCINTNMKNNAYKFLKFTSVSFKQELLPDFVEYDDRGTQSHRDMIGNSLLLADIYGEKCRGSISNMSYLYSVNDVEYLKLVEKHTKINDHYYSYSYNDDSRFGSKLSRSILKKHKTRILDNPLPYLMVLKKSELIKYSSSDDAKIFAIALFPKEVDQFWRMNYYKKHKPILDLVKTESIYEFIKQIFSDKYPNEDFEMTKEFYKLKYYDLMTVKERETWALTHIEKKTGVIPEDEDYLWYKFVNFPQAFDEIKKKIRITTNAVKRSNMLETLIKSATSQNELYKLLSYYYERHVNDRSHLKNRFLKNVTEVHSVFELDSVCWDAFDKLLHSHDVYNSCSVGEWNEFLCDSLLYHIINKRTLSNNLTQHLNNRRYLDEIKERSNVLCADKKDLVYNYVFQFLTDKLKGFELSDYNAEVKKQVRVCLELMLRWKRIFKKDGEYPEIALKFMRLDSDCFHYIVNPKPVTKEKDISDGFLIRCLKQDPTVILQNFSLIEKKLNSSRDFRLNTVLKKMKIYFSNDLAKQYIDLCKTSLSNISSKDDEKYGILFDRNAIFSSIYAIFQLGDEHTKTQFMDKHAPTNSKIEYDKIDQYLRYTQEAICRLHCYSRPPVPLAQTFLYLKGDYVHLSNDMFNMYLMKLPPIPRSEFVKFLLGSPVSIQKRGLRLAFHAFETSELKDVVFNVWKKTKNVSVRSNLFISIVEKIKNEKKKSQLELFGLLKALASRIHQDDDEKLFEYFTGHKIPEYLRGEYLETAWKTVLALPENKANIQRKTDVAKAMKSNIVLIDESHVEALVYSHVRKRLLQEKLRPEENSHIEPLNEALWDFVVEYIVNVDTELKQEKSLNVIKLIVEECFNHWNETHNTENFVYQFFFKDFVNKLDCIIYVYEYRTTDSSRVIRIFEYLLECFEKKFRLKEMYSYYWDWKLSIITRTVINGRDEFDKEVYIRFGSELGLFVKYLKKRNCYYNSFLSKIMGKIKQFITILNIRKIESITENDLKVFIAYGLTLQETLETSILALHILPQDMSTISVAGNELQEVMNKIKKQNHEELDAFMNDKFIYSDCKVRKIMIT